MQPSTPTTPNTREGERAMVGAGRGAREGRGEREIVGRSGERVILREGEQEGEEVWPLGLFDCCSFRTTRAGNRLT